MFTKKCYSNFKIANQMKLLKSKIAPRLKKVISSLENDVKLCDDKLGTAHYNQQTIKLWFLQME